MFGNMNSMIFPCHASRPRIAHFSITYKQSSQVQFKAYKISDLINSIQALFACTTSDFPASFYSNQALIALIEGLNLRKRNQGSQEKPGTVNFINFITLHSHHIICMSSQSFHKRQEMEQYTGAYLKLQCNLFIHYYHQEGPQKVNAESDLIICMPNSILYNKPLPPLSRPSSMHGLPLATWRGQSLEACPLPADLSGCYRDALI